MGWLVLFWIAALLLAYVHAGYPILMGALARLRPRPPAAADILPSISIVVVAHDEGRQVRGRLENLLCLDYPRDRLEIVLGSDGSTDGTVGEALGFEKDGVRVAAFPERRGKAAVIDDLVPSCRGDVVVLADARQRFEPGALRRLVRSFADPEVGAVSGALVLDRGAAGAPIGAGVGFYWRRESALRRAESLVDSTVGATGAFYAIRRRLFAPIPRDTILDDVLIPMRIMHRGYRVVCDPEARAHDRPACDPGAERSRKIRTIAGNFQLFARDTWLLNPCRNRLWLQTVSHKGLRLLGPILLAALFGSSLALAERPFFAAALLAQVLFHAAGVAGSRLRDGGRRLRFLAIPAVVWLLTCATVVAFARFLSGRQRVTWDRA
jgi:cellulose synthase/poly-beta-1,6-N-acetylglucosamine synthase-like glycosyltransferase